VPPSQQPWQSQPTSAKLSQVNPLSRAVKQSIMPQGLLHSGGGGSAGGIGGGGAKLEQHASQLQPMEVNSLQVKDRAADRQSVLPQGSSHCPHKGGEGGGGDGGGKAGGSRLLC